MVGPSIGQREAAIIAEEVGAELGSITSSVRVVILDFSDVRIISTMGIGMCIDLRQRADALGAPTVIFGLQADLAELFKMMKMDRLCRIVHEPDELQRAVAA